MERFRNGLRYFGCGKRQSVPPPETGGLYSPSGIKPSASAAGVCFLFCPDAAIRKTSEGYFEADLYYCKGCGICVQECVTGCITMVEEEE